MKSLGRLRLGGWIVAKALVYRAAGQLEANLQIRSFGPKMIQGLGLFAECAVAFTVKMADFCGTDRWLSG